MPFANRHVRDRIKRVLLAGGVPPCGICGIDHLDLDAPQYSPNAIVVDHIVPTSEGGRDSLENSRLAGFRCNNRRNRYEGIEGVVKRPPGFVF